MSCEISNLPKYKKRKSPSIPANDCELGFIEIGNDGKYWQIVSAGKSQRWVKCGTGSTNCTQVIRKSIKKKSGKAKKITKSSKKVCPPGKVLSPKGRCIIDRSKSSSKIVKTKKVTKDRGSCVAPDWRLNAGLPKLPKKYLKRPGPPYPASECNEGDIKMGNDGKLYQNLYMNGRGGQILKWIKCGKEGISC